MFRNVDAYPGDPILTLNEDFQKDPRQGKINLSMAHGQPVVATSCAAEGMHLRDGEDVLIADDAPAFADAVLRLYDDTALWQRLAAGGLDNVRTHFSLDAARATVTRLFLGGIAPAASAHRDDPADRPVNSR